MSDPVQTVPRMQPQVVSGDDAETITYPADVIKVTRQRGGNVQVAICESTDRDGPPAHRHPWDEVQIVIDGEAEFRVGSATWSRGRTGTVQFLPRGVAHRVRVPQGTARLVQVSIGDPYDVFARAMARALADGSSVEKLAELAAKHGVELA